MENQVATGALHPTESKLRFGGVSYKGTAWDLSHLESITMTCDIAPNHTIHVVVIFTSHCFTHGFRWDSRPLEAIPEDEVYDDGRERRVLSPNRYSRSIHHLVELVKTLPTRKIVVANVDQRNLMTVEFINNETTITYGVFFEVERDNSRKNRVLLRIQSAYDLCNGLTARQRDAKRVKWSTLIKATYEGRKIKP